MQKGQRRKRKGRPGRVHPFPPHPHLRYHLPGPSCYLRPQRPPQPLHPGQADLATLSRWPHSHGVCLHRLHRSTSTLPLHPLFTCSSSPVSSPP